MDCGSIPYIQVKKRKKKTFNNSLCLLNERISQGYVEAIRKLRIKVMKDMEENQFKSIMITSSIPGEEIVLSERFACPYCDFSLAELEPRIFSFNAPYGACPECKGLGVKYKLDIDLIIPDKNLSINEGGIKVINLEEDSSTIRAELNALSKKYDIDLDLPIKKLDKDKLDIILYGSPDEVIFNYVSKNGSTRNTKSYFEGIITNLERRYIETKSTWIRDWSWKL